MFSATILRMKASRLLHLLLLLQTRQRMTTAELAERLEVSRRTVLRDVDALSAAGVPVYTERGRHGGIALLPGARLDLSALDQPELDVLSLAGLDADRAHQLGLSDAHESAARKIAARRESAVRHAASRQRLRRPPLADVVIVDGGAWFRQQAPGVDVSDLTSAVRVRRRLRLGYRRSGEPEPSTLVVDPYGVVTTSGRWYLVADDAGTARLFALERLTACDVLEEPAMLREGQTLRTVWTALRERVEERGRVTVTARLRAGRVDLARRILGTRLEEVGAAKDGWCVITVRYPELEGVRQLLQFGDHIEILAPHEARDRFRALALDLAERHGAPPCL